MAGKTASPEKKRWVRLTRACNNRCLFCLDAEAQNGAALPLAEIRADLEAGRREGCRRAVLSGGEPTLHPEFVRIVALARRLGYEHVQAITNGRRFCYPEFLRAAVKAGLKELTFSVHGATAEVHDALTGVRGSFAQALAGLANALATPGLIVSSDVVVNRLNAGSLLSVVELLYSRGVREYDLLNLIPFGDAWKNWRRLGYRPAALRGELARVFRFAEASGARVWTNRFPPELLEGEERYLQHPEKLTDEARGMRAMMEAFLQRGERQFCRGVRCRSCVMARFCRDLALLRAAGRLPAQPAPRCLPDLKRPRGFIRVSDDMPKIAEFFVRGRYMLKGSGCRRCAERARCAGAPALEVYARGFAAFKPLGRPR